ncbi:uncharacterized protein CBL_09773 [Carabus blaptoides fortunei]
MKFTNPLGSSMWTQILAVFAATLGTISDGIQYGWSSPALPVLHADDTPVKISEDDDYWLEMLYMVGGMAGLPITIFLVDKIGRKWSIIVASVANLISWIMIGSASNVIVLYCARFLTGMGADVAFVSAPMYIAECADAKIRGFLGTFIYIMMIIGVLVSYCVVPYVPIWASSCVGACLVVIQILIFVWMPQSPYYLLINSKRDKAKKALTWLRRRADVEDELKEIESAVERQNSERGRPIDLVMIPSNRKALLIMTTLNTVQHFCGISVILMNVETILKASGSIIDSKISAILFGVCMLIASVGGSPFIDKFGRKVLLISSSVLSAMFLGILGIYFFLKDVELYDLESYKIIPLLSVLGYALAYKYGLGLVPIVTTGELFPTPVKAMGMTMADLVYTVMAVVSLKVYYVTLELYGMYFPFLLFSVCGLFTAGFVYWVVPETKGKTLEEIQQILKGNVQTKM